jgi:hypothetical protein
MKRYYHCTDDGTLPPDPSIWFLRRTQESCAKFTLTGNQHGSLLYVFQISFHSQELGELALHVLPNRHLHEISTLLRHSATMTSVVNHFNWHCDTNFRYQVQQRDYLAAPIRVYSPTNKGRQDDGLCHGLRRCRTRVPRIKGGEAPQGRFCYMPRKAIELVEIGHCQLGFLFVMTCY